MKKAIVNVDDAGMCLEVNEAIRRLHRQEKINSVSIMADGLYCEEITSYLVSEGHSLRVGVHLDLTYGNSLGGSQQLSHDGVFRLPYPTLLRKTLFGPNASLINDIETELSLQVEALLAYGLALSHLDSHLHVHMIPSINQIVKRLAAKYDIPYIRDSRDCLVSTVCGVAKGHGISPVGLAKSFFIKCLGQGRGYDNETAFFSTMYSGRIDTILMRRAIAALPAVEIMVHPGVKLENTSSTFLKKIEQEYWQLPERIQEYEACENGVASLL